MDLCFGIGGARCALGWSFVSISGIIIGAWMGVTLGFSHKTIANTMAVAAGLLIAAATLELTTEALHHLEVIWYGFIALLVGAGAFSWANSLLADKGAAERKRCGACVAQANEEETPGSGMAILLGTAMDAVPEAIVLGLTLFTQGPQLSLILAIALGNLPEALSASTGMLHAGRKKSWIYGMWIGVAVMTIVLTMLGYLFAQSISSEVVALLQMFGAGALIAMVTETLIPEAVEGTPRFAGLIAAIGFALLIFL